MSLFYTCKTTFYFQPLPMEMEFTLQLVRVILAVTHILDQVQGV